MRIDDLYVCERFRGTGVGRTLLASLARRCIDENLSRLEWAVLSWNSPSIRFFETAGARLIGRMDTVPLWALFTSLCSGEAPTISSTNTNATPPG